MKRLFSILLLISIALSTFSQVTTITPKCWDPVTKRFTLTIHGAPGTIAHVATVGLPPSAFNVNVTSDPFDFTVPQTLQNSPVFYTVSFTNGSNPPFTTVTGFTTKVGCTLTLPLPVTVINWRISGDILYWTTTIEENNAYFSIQGSNDGLKFVEITKVKSYSLDGNSTVNHNYSYKLLAKPEFAGFGIIFILMLGFMGYSIITKKKQHLGTIAIVAIMLLGVVSCKKDNVEKAAEPGLYKFYKLLQVDKDGTPHDATPIIHS